MLRLHNGNDLSPQTHLSRIKANTNTRITTLLHRINGNHRTLSLHTKSIRRHLVTLRFSRHGNNVTHRLISNRRRQDLLTVSPNRNAIRHAIRFTRIVRRLLDQRNRNLTLTIANRTTIMPKIRPTAGLQMVANANRNSVIILLMRLTSQLNSHKVPNSDRLGNTQRIRIIKSYTAKNHQLTNARQVAQWVLTRVIKTSNIGAFKFMITYRHCNPLCHR